MRIRARTRSCKIRGNDTTRMFEQGLSTEPPRLVGFIMDTTDPTNRMHNFELSCKYADILKAAFEDGNDVRDGSLFDVTLALICVGWNRARKFSWNF